MCCLLVIALNFGLITITVNVPVIPLPDSPKVEKPVYWNPYVVQLQGI